MNYLRLKASGDRMLPFFTDSDTLIIKKISFRQIKIDDFVTFKAGNKYVTHRVIYKRDAGRHFVITKGDQNSKPDEIIYPGQILGKVILVKRGNKSIHIQDIYIYQSNFYYQEIIRVKNLFLKKEINFLILKGLPLHLYFEKRFPSRIYADCDILIDRKEFDNVNNLFQELGYKKIDESINTTFKKLRDKNIEIQYKKITNGVPVIFDLHLEAVFLMTQLGNLDPLFPQKIIDDFSAYLLTEKKDIKIQNETYPILSNEALLIYLSLHLFHHNFQGYYRYELIKKILKGFPIDFKKTAQIINLYRLKNFTYPVFLILKKHYSINLPSQFSSIRPNKNIITYVKKNILSLYIYSEETRIYSGARRFKNIFMLSPEPIYKKILIFLNLQVGYALYFTITKKLNLFTEIIISFLCIIYL